MSEDTIVEANPAATKGNPSLLQETNQNISSMADAFKQAMCAGLRCPNSNHS